MFILEYNEQNYSPGSRLGINVDIDGNPIDVTLLDEKEQGASNTCNGDIVLVRKRHQQLFTRTYKEEEDITGHRSTGYALDGLPKLHNGNTGGGTKSQASTASSSATRDSGISVTDAQKAADDHRRMYLSHHCSE